jgi:hypothetical protein
VELLLLLVVVVVQVVCLGVSHSMMQQQGMRAAVAACSMAFGTKDMPQQQEPKATGRQRTGRDWAHMPEVHVTQV